MLYPVHGLNSSLGTLVNLDREAEMDNANYGTLISSIDTVNGLRFAAKEGILDVDSSGETLLDIAAGTGLHPNKVDALIRMSIFYGYLKEDGEKLFLTKAGADFIDQGGEASTLNHYAELVRNIQTAVRGNFFEMPEGGETLEETVMRTGIAIEKVEAFAKAGLFMDALAKNNGRYFLTKGGEAFLTNESPYSMAQLFGWLPLDYDMFKAFFDGSHPAIFANSEQMAQLMLTMMHQKSAWLANKWPERVDLSDAHIILDIGAGSGIHTIEACRQNKHLSGIALEQAWNCPIVGGYISCYGLSERVSVCPADMFKDDWPGPVDAIIMCDIIHDWSKEKAQALLARAYSALSAGGRIIVLETLLDDKRTGPFSALAFNIAVVKMLPDGGQRTANQIQSLLEEAGFGKVTMEPTVSNTTLIQAAKL